MPSPALIEWNTGSATALSELEALPFPAAGARALQLRYAYVLLLCAHFQAFCRALHSNATQALVESLDPGIGAVLDTNLAFARQLDRGNAQPGSIGNDFGRFELDFWPTVEATDSRSAARRRKLEELNAWRNAIAHHDVDSRRHDLHPSEVTLAACRSWLSACNGLAGSFDRAVADRLTALLGHRPW